MGFWAWLTRDRVRAGVALAGALAALTLGAAGPAEVLARPHSHHGAHHKKHKGKGGSCVTRHNDNDADNQGGPNDGDGCK
jgi:hypothetical protein